MCVIYQYRLFCLFLNCGAISIVANPKICISYGDYTPKSDVGKLAVAGYALMAVNVMAGILKPSREYLENLCCVTHRSTALVKPTKLLEELKKKED